MNSKNGRPKKNHQVPSRKDLECVWVEAGVIGSKVCDMDFECEKCPLDMALRQGFRGPHEEAEAAIPVPAAGVDLSELGIQRAEIRERVFTKFFHQLEQFSLRDDRYYYRSHTWVQDGGWRTTPIGVNDFAARLLPHANSIVFPSVGSRVQQGEYCSWFVSPEGTIAFVSPATGTVVGVNDELYGMPDLVRTSPYEKGWLTKIELERFPLDMGKLVPRISATARCRKDIERLRRQLAVLSKVDVAEAGVTLLDGGRYVENVQTLLGLRKYVELISVLFKP
jgi:glycine cleavage system H lipoate-binding protein